MATDNVKTLKKVVANYKKRQEEDDDNIIYDPAEQVEGYKKRIEGSGLDVEKETDKRSLIEKAFNLPEDQNPLFDVFEIINRPQQAIFGAIKANQEGRDFLEGAKEGITGEKRTPFKEILNEAGLTDDSGKKLGADDVLGFMGDVFLDPADLALFPVSASAKAIKTAKLGDQAVATAKAIKLAEKGLETADATTKVRTSLTALTLKGIGTGFKKTISLADTGLEHLLKAVDVSHIRMMERVGKKVDINKLHALKGYRSAKEMLQKTFDYTKGLRDNLFSDARKIRGSGRAAKTKADLLLYDAEKGYIKVMNEDIAEFIKKNPNYTEKEVNEFLGLIIENGAKTFSLDGKLTIEGQKHVTSMASILNGDAWLTNTGLDRRTMEEVTIFLDKYFPEIRKGYLEGGTEGLSDYFIKYDGDDVINDTYRIATPELHNEIKRKVSSLSDGSIEQRLKDPASKMTPQELKQKAFLEEEAAELLEQQALGAKKVIRYGTAEFARVKKMFDEVETAQQTVIELTRRGRPSKITAKMTKAQRQQRALELNKSIASRRKALENYINIKGIDINDAISSNRLQYAKYADVSDVTDGDIYKLMQNDIVIDNYLTDAMKKKVEEFGKLEGVDKMLNTTTTFMTKATEIVQELLDTGFTLTDGYLAHTMTDEWAKLRLDKLDSDIKDVWSSTRNLRGDGASFGMRKYRLSTVEANATAKNYVEYLKETLNPKKHADLLKRLEDSKFVDMFSTELTTSVADFSQKLIKSTEDAKMLELVLASDVFDVAEDLSKSLDEASRISKSLEVKPWKDAFKPNAPKNNAFVRIVEPNEKTPVGFVKVNGAALQEKLKKMAVYTKNDALYEKAMNMTALVKSDQLYIDNNINMLIGRVTDNKETNALIEGIDMLNNMFKKNKLLSPGFQLRNVVGNLSNMWLSGMSTSDIFKMTKSSGKIVSRGDDIFKRVTLGYDKLEDLSKADRLIYEEYSEFMQHGFGDLGNALRDIPEHLWNQNAQLNHYKAYRAAKKVNPNLKPTALDLASAPKNAYNSLISKNMHANQAQDALFRMTAWRYAKQNPEFLKKMGYSTPEDYVRRTLFDFQDLSYGEKEVMRKFIPFYTFTKKNLGFQLQNLMKNGNKYHRIIKSFNNIWGNLDLEENQTDKFKVENFWIPLPFIDEDGKYKAIKSSLPLGDLGEFMDRPMQRILASTAPFVRAPFEMALNKQVFSEMPIQEFKGQKGFYIPELGKKTEYALSQAGLDVPVSAAFDVGRTVSQAAKGEIKNPLEAMGNAFGRTIVSEGDPQKTAQRNAYNELDDLQNLMRYYKQEGIEILKIAEIENANKFGTTKNIIQKLREINNR